MVSRLNELAMREGISPKYSFKTVDGKSQCSLLYDGRNVQTGWHGTRKEAKQCAAEKMLSLFEAHHALVHPQPFARSPRRVVARSLSRNYPQHTLGPADHAHPKREKTAPEPPIEHPPSPTAGRVYTRSGGEKRVKHICKSPEETIALCTQLENVSGYQATITHTLE